MRRSGWPEIGGPTNEACGEVCGPPYHFSRPALDGSCLVRLVRVHVVLEDVSLADAQATVIVEETIQSAGQVPVPFTLQLDPAAIDPRHRYAVRVQIADAIERLRWVSTDLYPVLTHGSPYFSAAVPRYIFGPASPDISVLYPPSHASTIPRRHQHVSLGFLSRKDPHVWQERTTTRACSCGR